MEYKYKRRTILLACCVILGMQVLPTHGGLYLPRRAYTFYTTDTPTPGELLGVIHLGQNSVLDCDVGRYESPLKSPGYVTLELDGTRILLSSGPDSLSSVPLDEGITFPVNLTCRDAGQEFPLTYYEPLTRASVRLQLSRRPALDGHVAGSVTSDHLEELAEVICPKDSDLVYDIIENTEKGNILDSLMATPWLGDDTVVEISLSSQDDVLSLVSENSSQILTLNSSPDREKSESIEALLTCRVTFKDHSEAITKDVAVKANIYDVDDNPPLANGRPSLYVKPVTRSSTAVTKYLATFDKDGEHTTNERTYRISTNDTTGAVTILSTSFTTRPGNTVIITTLNLSLSHVTAPFTADIYVDDLTYKPYHTGSPVSNRAITRLILKEETLPKPRVSDARLDVAAANFSVIKNLRSEKDGPDVTFRLLRIDQSGLADVTSAGRVYLLDSQLLRKLTANIVPVVVGRYVNGQQTSKLTLQIMITDNLRQGARADCDLGCSMYVTETDCESRCGLAAASGLCAWRLGDITLSSNYSTCSPNLETCPDGDCDDIESLHWAICPQDCSADTMTGQIVRGPEERGISKAWGTCFCGVDHSCTCEPTDRADNITGLRTRPVQSNPGGSKPLQRNNPGPAHARSSRGSVCSDTCRVTLAAVFSGLVIVVAIALAYWLRHRRCRGRRCPEPSLKHFNSLTSVGAVPSDYIVDDSHSRGDVRVHAGHGGQRQVTTSSSPSSAGQWGSSKTAPASDIFDDNWEIPRNNLTLEHVLGEGEFGQVVRAQACNLRGQEGNTVVAVKMLKPDASGTEYQDLASEFQLMKEVDHPNVIKLLGVCTQKGPLYLIVEYCELGSLRSFLRASKFKNKGSWEDKQRMADDNVGETIEGRVITNRDLFSFAWQIAKGMDYLAGLKIVHRDLAARNVLVTEGLKMKISDFGLSRDVYEMETYLKMSKGRIPVKWMAPESLYGQVYTTKSDIWSYGIVLWETVTLGASPYPGIPPERLFPLLSTGYRMDRPEDCPEELYAIMQKCWKSEPEQRPTFATLVRILDNILQQNTDYLDLTDENYMVQSSTFDTEEKGSTLVVGSNKQSTLPPHASSLCSGDNNQQDKLPPANKVGQYCNLQSTNSDSKVVGIPAKPDPGTKAEKSNARPDAYITCAWPQKEGAEADSETEAESHTSQEKSLLLKPVKAHEVKVDGHDLVTSTGGGRAEGVECAHEGTASSQYKNTPARLGVHENLTYV